MDYLSKVENLDMFAQDKLVIYARCDHDGYKWWNTWWDGEAKEKAANLFDIGNECSDVVFDLMENVFPNGVQDISKYMMSGKAECLADKEGNIYCLGKYANYWIRLIARKGDYNMYVKAFLKDTMVGE